MLKKSVRDYFDDDEEEQPEENTLNFKHMNKINFSNTVQYGWQIKEAIHQRSNIYKVVCPCGKELIRDIYAIIHRKVNRCCFCYRKYESFANK